MKEIEFRISLSTSLASGCLAPTCVDVDQTSFDIFRTRVSKQPARTKGKSHRGEMHAKAC